jgi:hypothetical protein
MSWTCPGHFVRDVLVKNVERSNNKDSTVYKNDSVWSTSKQQKEV